MKLLKEQLLPILLTAFICLCLIIVLHFFVQMLNLFPIQGKIIPQFRIADILIGMTIYLKTAIDFALFIGKLMRDHPGWKNRIAIETGTALGNSVGTLSILAVWTLFKDIPLLLAAMILLASLVLFRLAEDSLEELRIRQMRDTVRKLTVFLQRINTFFAPLTSSLFPPKQTRTTAYMSFLLLLAFSFRIPFILGLDDFAGYIPLFSLVNVVSFITGVFVGHMLLNAFLFASPRLTTKIISLPAVSLIGGIAFLLIGSWGFIEALHILIRLFVP